MLLSFQAQKNRRYDLSDRTISLCVFSYMEASREGISQEGGKAFSACGSAAFIAYVSAGLKRVYIRAPSRISSRQGIRPIGLVSNTSAAVDCGAKRRKERLLTPRPRRVGIFASLRPRSKPGISTVFRQASGSALAVWFNRRCRIGGIPPDLIRVPDQIRRGERDGTSKTAWQKEVALWAGHIAKQPGMRIPSTLGKNGKMVPTPVIIGIDMP